MHGFYYGGAQWRWWGSWLFWIHLTSWGLLLFNLLPIYPFDGGQLLQAILWPRFGYYKSMLFATTTGIVGGAILTGVGLVSFRFMLTLLGLMGLMNCIAMRRMLLAEGPWAFQEEDGIDYSASLFTSDPDKPKRKHLSKRKIRRAQKREAEERAEQERVDAILAKVSAHGMHSLTWWEKRSLKRATERQRKRDLEVKQEMTRKGF
jgi:hypothetical protein